MSKHNLQERLFCNYRTKQRVRWDIIERPVAKENSDVINQSAAVNVNKPLQPMQKCVSHVTVKVLPNPQLTREVKKFLASRNAIVSSLRHAKSVQACLGKTCMIMHLWSLNGDQVVMCCYRTDTPSRNEVWKSFHSERLQSGSAESRDSVEQIIRNLLRLSRSETRFYWM